MLGWVLKPLALASTLALSTLGLLGRKYQRARFIFHFTLYVSTLGAMSVWGVVVSLLATLAGQVSDASFRLGWVATE
jgi:lysophosphatidate acyltransferase